MKAYADSSFIVRLVTAEAESPRAVAEYRRLGSPKLVFLPLHALEVRNAILQRAFHQRRTAASNERQQVERERDSSLARIERLIARRALIDVTLDMEAAFDRAAKLSAAQTERLGARAIDLLHVAAALTLESELFITADARQAELAKTQSLKVISVD